MRRTPLSAYRVDGARILHIGNAMNDDTTVVDNPNSGRRWILPVVLALVILAIIAGAFFATHPHVFGSGATATPTATATATAVPTATGIPTATAVPTTAPTGTPKPGPTGTPRPGPTATPKPAPTSTVKLGTISYPPAQLDAAQRNANAGNSSYTYYLNPFMVLQKSLPSYGFQGGFKVVSPAAPPQPTPTPFTGSNGLPQVKIRVQYQGKTYVVTLEQPRQKGPKGIWVISMIAPG